MLCWLAVNFLLYILFSISLSTLLWTWNWCYLSTTSWTTFIVIITIINKINIMMIFFGWSSLLSLSISITVVVGDFCCSSCDSYNNTINKIMVTMVMIIIIIFSIIKSFTITTKQRNIHKLFCISLFDATVMTRTMLEKKML